MSKKVTRLYEQFVPDNYTVWLSISEDKNTFTGKVVIDGRKVGRPSKRITLHQKSLTITSCTLVAYDKQSNETNVEITRVVKQDSFDELRIHTDKDLYPGRYKLEIEYSGPITQNMDGVYPCNFKEDGIDKKLIATQFESHHAREAMPCIDEPEAKATFELRLEHDSAETALSNTPVVEQEVGDTRTTSIFEKTPIMSTYLLAFVVGEMSYKETRSNNGVRIRTYATKDQIEHSEFALDIAAKCLDFYEEYFDIPYPLEKCDFVALPDFASGAMENWGLITFREQTLLCDEHLTSLSTRQYVALVVAHELTHQWFGNLVTMRWWTDLWLNEGFASWMEYLAIDHLFPEWNLWSQFAIDEQQAALRADALEHTHPIEVTVKHPDEIRTIFDTISYQKGASVIHMLNSYLGDDHFRDGLRHYLKKFSYKNTDTVDLWQALEDETKKPVKDFMHAWTSQSGFPILRVDVKNDHLVIDQSRFVSNPLSEARKDKNIWPIPLHAEGLDRQLVDKKKNRVPIRAHDRNRKLNISQTGFFRTAYSHELNKIIIDDLKAHTYEPLDRMGLLSDSFESVRAGYQPVHEYLDLLANFNNEDNLAVWEILASSIGSIRSVLSKDDHDDSLRDAMKPFVYTLIEPEYTRLGWKKEDNEPHLDTLLRPLILSLAASTDNQAVLKKIQSMYKAYKDGSAKLDPDLRSTILSTVARHGNKETYDSLLSAYEKSNSSDEKLSLTAAMTSFTQDDINNQVLTLIKTDTIRLQDKGYWIAYILMNRHSRSMAWQWLKENWQWFKEKNGTDLSFSRTPLYVARNFADQASLEDYKNFFSSVMEPMIERTYNQGIEIIETNLSWRERDSENAQRWFKSR